MSEFYKTLTPVFREEINTSIRQQMAELNTCEPNAFTSVQKIGLEAFKTVINALPDGYLLPMKGRD